MASVFSVEEQSAIDMLKKQSLVVIKQRIDHLTRVAVFEQLPPEQAHELLIAKLAFDLTSPSPSEVSKAARDAILARRNANWQRSRLHH